GPNWRLRTSTSTVPVLTMRGPVTEGAGATLAMVPPPPLAARAFGTPLRAGRAPIPPVVYATGPPAVSRGTDAFTSRCKDASLILLVALCDSAPTAPTPTTTAPTATAPTTSRRCLNAFTATSFSTVAGWTLLREVWFPRP